MVRLGRALCLAVTLIGAPGLAHNMPGLKPLKPGEAFAIGSMKAVFPVGIGNSQQNVLHFGELRDGSAMVFLVIDPNLPADVAEAHRFEKLLAGLKNTHGILVATPARSQQPLALGEALVREKLTLPIAIDDRDVFPFVFSVPMRHSPHYELFDQTQTLIIQNATSLRQKLPSGMTVADAVRTLDAGKFVHPEALPLHDLPPRNQAKN